jgi:hypothetical protein
VRSCYGGKGPAEPVPAPLLGVFLAYVGIQHGALVRDILLNWSYLPRARVWCRWPDRTWLTAPSPDSLSTCSPMAERENLSKLSTLALRNRREGLTKLSLRCRRSCADDAYLLRASVRRPRIRSSEGAVSTVSHVARASCSSGEGLSPASAVACVTALPGVIAATTTISWVRLVGPVSEVVEPGKTHSGHLARRARQAI